MIDTPEWLFSDIKQSHNYYCTCNYDIGPTQCHDCDALQSFDVNDGWEILRTLQPNAIQYDTLRYATIRLETLILIPRGYLRDGCGCGGGRGGSGHQKPHGVTIRNDKECQGPRNSYHRSAVILDHRTLTATIQIPDHILMSVLNAETEYLKTARFTNTVDTMRFVALQHKACSWIQHCQSGSNVTSWSWCFCACYHNVVYDNHMCAILLILQRTSISNISHILHVLE